jgi:hypothetical protein
MTGIRLFNTKTSTLETFELESRPPYLAVSHAWSDQFFPPGIPILDSPGGEVILKVIETRFPAIHYCWVDNFCILQDDDNDKAAQIPLMGSIYHDAAAVIIALKYELGITQEDVDIATRKLAPALKVYNKESLEEDEIRYWRYGSGRQLLVQAMNGLARFTCSSWITRVWTLQEYILASEVVWVGSDLVPISIDDNFFTAIPSFCGRLYIRECFPLPKLSPFDMLSSYFVGMANARLGIIDRTRVMELLSNRNSTVQVDEVYGIMASSGIEIEPLNGETRENAWERWCEAAITRGHLRWIMLVPSPPSNPSNCAIPAFADRGGPRSCFTTVYSVRPQGTVQPTVENGTFTVTGRHIGSCELIYRLGSVHRTKSDRFYWALSFILFSKGRWNLALRLARTLGADRYSEKQLVAIAQVITHNYFNALRWLQRTGGEYFRTKTTGKFQDITWRDFSQFTKWGSLLIGVGYLAKLKLKGLHFEIPIVVDTGVDVDFGPLDKEGRLEILDIGARTRFGRLVFMVIETPKGGFEDLLPSTIEQPFHKVGITLSVSPDYNYLWEKLPLQRFSIGGKGCQICEARKEAQVALPLQKIASSEEQKFILLKMKLKLRRKWLIRRGILSNPIYFMRFGKHHFGGEESA